MAERWVVKEPAAVAAQAQDVVVGALAAARAGGRRASLALSGGSTPEALYRRWADANNARAWQDLHLFYGDERAVPPDHADSNHGMATRAWLSGGTVAPACVHRLVGEASDLDAEAVRAGGEMDAVLGAGVGVDVMLLGMGGDAHTASLFPNSAALDATGRVVALHAGAPSHKRLTVTPAEILRAHTVVVLVTGAAKAEVLQRVCTGPLDIRQMPVQLALRLHPRALLLCDQAAWNG